jgi:hypothetical protein
VKEIVFNNVKEAEEAIIKENEWSYHHTYETDEGKKKFFRCNKVRRRGKQCDAGIYLLLNSTRDEVILFHDKSNHTHDNIPGKTSRISNNVKEVINELFELKLKPKAILEALHERGMAAPTIGQLNNFLRSIKTKKFRSTAISLGEIEQWCIESSQSIPGSDDAPFVVSYQIIYDDDDNEDGGDEDDDVNTNKFRFFCYT